MTALALERLNRLDSQAADEQFHRCCGSANWCQKMTRHRPYTSFEQLHHTADSIMNELSDADWLEAFASHPPIGNLESLKMKYAGNREWSAGEQAGIATADDRVLNELSRLNAEYRAKFGFIFIVFATGKSAQQMLALLQQRMMLDPSQEMVNAAFEQRKITHLRLDKLGTNLQ